jgi:TDG/mug DNA glycosylase family protein
MAQLAARSGLLPSSHYVPDILAPGLKVVFCGTALGTHSAEAKAYYANPGNFFWRTLHRIGLTPQLLKPQQYPEVIRHGIGLTDLSKTEYGQDAALSASAFDLPGLRQKILAHQPRYLAFTSKTGAAAFLGTSTATLPYGPAEAMIGDTRLFVLPSPSGQARIFWDESLWQQLADVLNTP